MEHLLRKVIGNEQSHPKGEACEGCNGQCHRHGAAQLFGSHILLRYFLGDHHGATCFNICPAGFCSCFIPFLFILVLLPFGVGMFAMHHCMLKIFNFIFYFHRGSQLRALSLRGGFQHELFSNAATVKTLSTFRYGLNAFCIKKEKNRERTWIINPIQCFTSNSLYY